MLYLPSIFQCWVSFLLLLLLDVIFTDDWLVRDGEINQVLFIIQKKRNHSVEHKKLWTDLRIIILFELLLFQRYFDSFFFFCLAKKHTKHCIHFIKQLAKWRVSLFKRKDEISLLINWSSLWSNISWWNTFGKIVNWTTAIW
jgi:hypothetical protein